MRSADFILCTAVLDGGTHLSRAELIGQLLELLAEARCLRSEDVAGIQAAVLRREQLGTTGIGNGLAFPNTRHPLVPRPMGILAVYRSGVEFESLDRELVDIICLCLTPPVHPVGHLGSVMRPLDGLVRTFRDSDFCQRLRRVETAAEVMELLGRIPGA